MRTREINEVEVKHLQRRGICLDAINPFVEQLAHMFAGGLRLDILRALVAGPLDVNAITEAVFAKTYAVSRDLGKLELCGLVRWKPLKKNHIYQLTERVNAIGRDEMMQISLSNGMGQWLMIHCDDMADPANAVPPPQIFIDGRAPCPCCIERMRAAANPGDFR